ncbi:MAG: UDP-N-acetylmuramoyl-tripeptide--D-alanyl-D-alanine ligase, partial [Alphaproteobacteria bacterium]|nr:UDP-N-acetylmuramoyl-tripeptide--D-alanyl-D-alanine ligase [Alphaproteobacteria bacterium]
MELNTKQIADILGDNGDVISAPVHQSTTDSRQVQNGDVFIAVKGEKFDGHDFVLEVLKKGASLAIVDHLIADTDRNKQIVVSDTLDAYGKIGAYMRSR